LTLPTAWACPLGLPAPRAGPGACGLIRGYRAVLDPAQMGVGFVAYVTVGLSSHTKAAQEAFERADGPRPEVRECHNITGAVEYLLRVEAADLAAYKHFHTEAGGGAAGHAI
jgi:Lrp/AsnC family transcriptional regulator, leucine-responsive regulatory protein